MTDPSGSIPVLEAGTPHPVDYRSILALAWPVIATNFLSTAVQWVDLLMVARLGKETVAAVGLASFFTTLVWALLMALQIGTQILVAQAYGAGDRRSIDRAVQLALLLGAGGALCVTALLTRPGSDLIQRIFRLFDVEPEVAVIGASYMRIVLFVLAGMIISLVAQAALRAVGDTRTPLWLTGASNVLNVIFNYGLIFGRLGLPELGVEGAAWGTVIARAVEAVGYLVLLYGGRLRIALRISRFAWDFDLLESLFRLGAPAAAEQLIMNLGLLIYQRVISAYGTEALAAYQIGVILLQAAFMPGFGFSVAATTLVGQWMGARRDALATLAGNRCRNLALVLMSVMGALFFLFAAPFSRAILDDDAVVPIATDFIRFLALAQPAMAVHFAMSGALRGAGDVRSPLWAAIIAMYLGRLPISLLAAFVFEWPVVYVFVGMLVAHSLRAVVLSTRWYFGPWRQLTVLPAATGGR